MASEFERRAWALQRAAGMSDNALADAVGVAPSTINRLKRGVYATQDGRPGTKVVRGLVVVFPELADLVPTLWSAAAPEPTEPEEAVPAGR